MNFANEVFQPTDRIVEEAGLVVKYNKFLSKMASAVDVKSFGTWVDSTRPDKEELRRDFKANLERALAKNDFVAVANWAMLLSTLQH